MNKFDLKFIVAIRSNHSVWLGPGQKVRYTKWKEFERVFSNGKAEVRSIREIIFGKRRTIRYWQITTDPNQFPDNATWFVMSNLPDVIPSINSSPTARGISTNVLWCGHILYDYVPVA